MLKENYKILVADDSDLTLKIIREILELLESDVTLFYAEDGKKACEIAEKELPDLILMDVIMPELNGIEAVKYLRKNELTSEIPIIVLSASESLNSAWDAGANNFISKPFQKYELLIKVRSALNLVQKIKEIRFQKSELEARHQEVIVQRDKIASQQKDILDDIHYSKRIQTAILPPDSYIKKALPEHFILNMPRNIVSGDFYWIGELGNKYVIAVADCTGHGISGAFMTMAGIAFLNDIISSSKIEHSSQILFELRKMVMKLLKQKGEQGEAADGMDVSLIIINGEQKVLEFAGANNPLYLIQNNELKIIKGDRMPIGIHFEFDKPFTDVVINLRQNDMIYMFTDGYADQFGGPANKKFRYKNFQDLLMNIHKQPMDKQKSELSRTIDDWKGNHFQVDDIMILGFKI